MKVLTKLFRAKPKQENLASQIKALSDLPQERLESIALSNQEESLRIEALQYLAYGNTIKQLATSAQHPKLEQAAKRRLGQLIDDNAVSFSTLSKDFSDEKALWSIAGYAQNNDFQEKLLENASDEIFLIELCLNTNASRIRQNIAKRISENSENRERLQQLLKTLKTKDKVAYKIVKTRYDALRENDKKREVTLSTINEICLEIEAHAERIPDHSYLNKLSRLKHRWEEVCEDVAPEIAGRYLNALVKCEQVLEEHRAELEKVEIAKAAKAGADAERQAIISEVSKLIAKILAFPELTQEVKKEVQETLLTLQTKWKESKTHKKAKQEDEKCYTQTRETLAKLLEQCEKYGTVTQLLTLARQTANTSPQENILEDELEDSLEKNAPKDVTQEQNNIQNLEKTIDRIALLLQACSHITKEQIPDIAADAREYISKHEQQIKHRKEKNQKITGSIKGMIKRANHAIEQGKLKQALGIQRSINEKLKELNDIPSFINAQVESLNESIEKLLDWKNYATLPKKEALIDSMSALIGVSVPPEQLANKIRGLQDEWRSLSQGSKDQHQELWERFNDASSQAYEPCKLFFQKLADERKQNLEKRVQLVSQLQDYYTQYNWQEADWKQVEKTVRTAKQEWFSYSPTERVTNKPVQEEFDRIIGHIQEKLNTYYQKNKEAKNTLIEHANKLLDNQDIDSAIEQAKRLQQQWKNIGRCERKEDDQLWKQFREHADAVFAKRAEIQAEKNQQLDTHLTDANSIIKKLNDISLLSGQALLDARQERDDLIEAFKEVGDLPKAKVGAVEKQFKAALSKIENKLIQERETLKQKAWDNLLSAVEQVNDLERKAYSLDEDLAKSKQNELIQAFDDETNWPEGGHSALKRRLATLSTTDAPNFDENETQLRTLCIRAEIIADIPTPESDQQLRTQYQVTQLQKGFLNNAQLPKNEAMAELTLEWASVSATSSMCYTELYNRFIKCREASSK